MAVCSLLVSAAGTEWHPTNDRDVPTACTVPVGDRNTG